MTVIIIVIMVTDDIILKGTSIKCREAKVGDRKTELIELATIQTCLFVD